MTNRLSLALLLTLLLTLLAPLPAYAQTPVSAGDAVAADGVDAQLAGQAITTVQFCIDAVVPCVTVTTAAGKFVDAPPAPSGSSSYKAPLPTTFTVGSVHTVIAKFCNVSACGPASSPLSFVWVLPTPTAVPSNLRIKVGG